MTNAFFISTKYRRAIFFRGDFFPQKSATPRGRSQRDLRYIAQGQVQATQNPRSFQVDCCVFTAAVRCTRVATIRPSQRASRPNRQAKVYASQRPQMPRHSNVNNDNESQVGVDLVLRVLTSMISGKNSPGYVKSVPNAPPATSSMKALFHGWPSGAPLPYLLPWAKSIFTRASVIANMTTTPTNQECYLSCR